MIATTYPKRKLQKLVDLTCAQREAELRKQFRQRMTEETLRERLAQVAETDDPDVLGQLQAAGFRPETVPALNAAPIAFAAWGSGAVTESERKLAAEAIFSEELAANPESIKVFCSWLEQRPGKDLWKLWRSYTSARLSRTPLEERKRRGRWLLGLAERVARASSGFLGFRRICFAEQQVLDGIKRVYSLD
jgi:hypothetical protein